MNIDELTLDSVAISHNQIDCGSSEQCFGTLVEIIDKGTMKKVTIADNVIKGGAQAGGVRMLTTGSAAMDLEVTGNTIPRATPGWPFSRLKPAN
jgi:hypothetical protein